jgi:uncharacterized damage-inducible protein DinB
MDPIERIVDQMERAHVGDPWTDVPLVSLLEDLTHEEAAAKPIPGSHSIWEIVLHLGTAQELIVDLVRGTSRPYEPGDEWPPVGEPTKEAWDAARARFREGEAEVRSVVAEGVLPEQLDAPFREGGTPAYNNLHGYVQHAIYHGGQISVLRRLLRADD